MFSESLKIDIVLEISGTKFNIPGGNIKMCELNLHSFGFDGKAEFGLFSDLSEDKLFSLFITNSVLSIVPPSNRQNGSLKLNTSKKFKL